MSLTIFNSYPDFPFGAIANICIDCKLPFQSTQCFSTKTFNSESAGSYIVAYASDGKLAGVYIINGHVSLLLQLQLFSFFISCILRNNTSLHIMNKIMKCDININFSYRILCALWSQLCIFNLISVRFHIIIFDISDFFQLWQRGKPS